MRRKIVSLNHILSLMTENNSCRALKSGGMCAVVGVTGGSHTVLFGAQ